VHDLLSMSACTAKIVHVFESPRSDDLLNTAVGASGSAPTCVAERTAVACPSGAEYTAGDARSALPGIAAWLAAGAQLAEAASGADGWSVAERRSALELLDRVADAVTLTRSRVLAAEREAGSWAVHGDRDLEAWRARCSRAGRGAASAQVRQADTLARLPQVASALAAGTVTGTHVDRLARFVAGASTTVQQQLASEHGQGSVVGLASRLDATQFGQALERLGAELDPAARQRDFDAAHAARYLNLTDSGGSTLIKGQLDTLAGQRLRLALQAVTPRPAADDDRDPAQRRADALTAVAEHALSRAPNVPGDARPHVSVVLREETFAALRQRGDGPPAADGVASGSAAVVGGALEVARRLRGVPSVIDEAGIAWPASEVARVLCDCRLARVVVDARDVPRDLGRSERLFSRDQRRAVVVRDGAHCGWPGCTTPARWTEVHHIRWWHEHGGRSDLDNAVLLCSYHHHVVHRRGLSLARVPSREVTTERWTYRVLASDGRCVADAPCPPARTMSDGAPTSGAPPDGTSRPRSSGGMPHLRTTSGQLTSGTAGGGQVTSGTWLPVLECRA